MKERIYEVLNKVGVPCHLKGRRYLETAIEIVLESGSIPMMKALYPSVAQRHSTDASGVEKSIGYAIDRCFCAGVDDSMVEVFGNIVNRKENKLSASEFIYGLRSYLEAEALRKSSQENNNGK